MSTITNKESLRNIHYNLTKKINGWDMSFEDFAKSMEDASVRHNVNNSLKVYFPGYSGTDEEFDKALGVIKSDLPSPTDEIQQMSRPENNTAIINDLSKNLLEESQRMGIQPPKNEERTFDDLYNSGDIYGYMEKADEQGNKKTVSALNDYAKERRKAEVEAIDKQIAELEKKDGYYNQRAISALKNARENLLAPSKYDDITWKRNFVADAALGLWQNLDEEKIPYAGAFVEAGDYIKAAGIIKDINDNKEISKDDEDFLNAFMTFINSSREDTSIGYKGGSAAAESAPLAAEMAVAGMTFGGSGAATVAAQTAKKTAMKAALEVIKKYAKKTAKGAAKHAGMTAMNPTVWAKEMSQDYFGHAARGEDYTTRDALTGIGSALLTTGVERGTGKLLSPITKHIPMPNILKQTGKWAKYAALDDVPTEIAEEYIEALASLGRSYIDPIADKEAKEGMREGWKELTTAEGFGTTATSVAIMSLMGKGINAGLLAKKNRDLKKSAAKISEVLSNLELEESVKNDILSTLANSKVEDGKYAISVCGDKLRDAGVYKNLPDWFFESVWEYLDNKASVNSYMSEFDKAYNSLSKEEKAELDKAIIGVMNQRRAEELAFNVIKKHADNTVFTDESGSKTYSIEQLYDIFYSGGKTEAEKAVYNTLYDGIEKELPYLLIENAGLRDANIQKIEQKILRTTTERVAQAKGMKRWQVASEYNNIYERLKNGEVLTDYEKDLYDIFTKERERVAKLYGNTNKQSYTELNTKQKVEVAPVEIVLEEQEKQEDTPSPIVSSTPTSSGTVSIPEIDTEAEVAKANATFGKASNKDGNLYEVSAFVNGKNVEGALKGEVVLTEDGKLDIENSKGLMFIPKGNGKYTSKAIPLTDAEYNSVTINNVFNKEQYAEQAVNNAKQAAQTVSLNELIRQTLQAQTTPETAENGVAEASSSTEGGVTDNAVENQVSYPTKKDGNIDYDNLTPEQEYSLTAQEYGEDVAQEDVKSYIEQYQSAIDNIQSQLDSKNGTNSRAKMREAMRKNQEKLEAWKALLKEEIIAEENTGENLAEEEKSSTFDNNKRDETGNGKVDNSVVQQRNGEIRSTVQGDVWGTRSGENEGLVDGTRNGNAENGRNGGTDNGISNESNSSLSVDKEVETNTSRNGGKVSESDQRGQGADNRANRTPQGVYGKYDKRGLAQGVREGTSKLEFEREGDTGRSGIEQTKRDGNATNSERVGRNDNDVAQKVSELSDQIEKEPKSSQTPEEVVQQAIIDTAEQRADEATADAVNKGTYIGQSYTELGKAEKDFHLLLQEYNIKNPREEVTSSNFLNAVAKKIKKLLPEAQREIMYVAVEYKKLSVDTKIQEQLGSRLMHIKNDKWEERKKQSDEIIEKARVANNELLDFMRDNNDFSYEKLLITGPSNSSEYKGLSDVNKELSRKVINTQDEYFTLSNRLKEDIKVREKSSSKQKEKPTRIKYYVKNKQGDFVEAWAGKEITKAGGYSLFKAETGQERHSVRTRDNIYSVNENGEYVSLKPQEAKSEVKISDISEVTVGLIKKIVNGEVGSVSELKEIIKSLKSKITYLCKKIGESEFSDDIKGYLLSELDSAYFLAEQNNTDGEQKKPTQVEGKISEALSKIRTTAQQKKGVRTYVIQKGETKDRKNETFETIDDLLANNKQIAENIQETLDILHNIIIETEATLKVKNEVPMYSTGETEGAEPISVKKTLASISNLISRLNLQGRVQVAMNLEQLKKINKQAYEAEMNGEHVNGFYIPSKHQIVLYVPNLLQKGVAEEVVFHEGIAHFGLRELLGEEEFNNFCKQVWKAMSYADKKEMMKYIDKKYVYNQKVDEEDMIAAAEEYVAHLAETPMFAEYLRNRNEQEAVSWINKKWKKVCDLIRKIFKKRTGEELLSSDENIMDALYRSYQLLDSNDYAMFDYYRSLTEQMRKEDVKVGEINEEELFSKKNSQKYQSASSDKSAGLNHSFSIDVDANYAPKVKINKEIAKRELIALGKAYQGIKKTRGFIGDLAKALGDYKTKQTYYFEFRDNNNNVYTLRISNHNVNGDNKGNNEEEISIVLKSRRSPNTHTPKANLKEYVYFKEDIKKGDGTTLELIAKDISTMLDTGVFVDTTGLAKQNPIIESENSSSTQEQGTILFSKGKPAGYVNLSNKFKPQKRPMSALVAREQAVANAVMEWFREMVGAENIVTNVRAMTDVYINALNNGERIRVLHTSKKGEDVILGFEHNGVHYLDMGAMDSGLLLYELGTVWVDILKKNDALWERAKEVCRSTKEYKSLVKTAAYKRGEVTEEDVVKEVLAYHISELGTRLGNNLNVSNDIKEEFEYKVGFAFAELKNTLSRFDEYELSKLGVEDFARLSLRDIVLNTSMADSEAVVSDLEDSSEAETPTGKRVKHGTYLRYAPRKNETTGEYLERLQKDGYWNEASRYGQADVDIAIAVLQSAVEKEMGGQIPEALDVYNMIDSFDSAAYNKINSFENNVAKPYKKLLRKLGKQLKKHPDIKSLKISRLDSVYWYMQAKDIVERQQIDGIDRGRKGLEDALGMSLERYIGLVEGFLGNESINKLWDETNSITDNILMMYKQLGEINDTDIASMKRRFYVPEIGFVDDKNKDGVSGRFAGRQVAPLSTDNKHQIKKSKGRGNSIADSPFYNMIDGSISLIYEIEKRKVQDALIGLAEYAMLNGVDISKFFVLNNEGGLLHDKSKGGSIKVGSPKDASYVYFNEQNNLGKTLQNAFSTSSKKGKYDGVVLWWKNFMSNSYTTWKLAFVFKNLPKDIKATLATATIKYGIGVPAKVSKNLLLKRLWWSVLKYNFNGSTKSKYGDLIKQYYESGAGTGYAELRHEKKLRQLESSAFERKYFNPFTYIELLADLSEGMPRIALYKAMLDSGYTEHSAKIAARNATINFGRQAGGVVADIATTAIPFYRASTSGGEGWLRTLTTRGEEKTSITNHLLRVSLTLTSLFAVGALMALADDEDDDDTDYDEWTNYLLRVNDSPYLEQDRMYIFGVVPSYFAQNHTPFVQAGYDFVRMLQDEKSGYDISVDFITNLLTSTIAANELQQLPVSLIRSIITDESLGDAITKQAIKMSDINPISKIARAWVGIDDFGNKRYENKNKSGYGNASGDAAYIYRKIADYAAGTSDMQHPEKAKEQYIDDNGEIQERKLNWVQDINSDKLEDVTNALLPFMEGFISSVSNAAEQLIEREEFDWLEFTKETPVINKVFYNTPKTNLEKLESGYKLMNRYINSYIQGEGDFGSKELKENNKYLRMNAFDDTTDYKKRLEEYEYYIKNYKGNEDIVKKIVERDIKTWKKRRKEMFGN